MEGKTLGVPRSFSTPEEELQYLREKVGEAERALSSQRLDRPRERAAHAVLQSHIAAVPADVREEEARPDAVTLDLPPEAHDEKMGEFLGILQEKGAWRAIAAVEATHNPHLIDDFHRLLVAYLAHGNEAKGLESRSPLARDLKMALYDIILPEAAEAEDKRKPLKELIASMEQLYQGLLALPKERGSSGHIAFEIANPVGLSSVSFYAAVPLSATELFERQLLAVFPKARISRRTDDYNLFSESAYAAASEARLSKRGIYSLKTYDEFEYDPINILLSSFNKLDRDKEGAAIQFIIEPRDGGLLHEYQHALERIHDGVPVDAATCIPTSTLGKVVHIFQEFFFPPKKREGGAMREADPRIKSIEKKIKSPIVKVNVRLVAGAATPQRAAAVVRSLEASFKQFVDTSGNALSFRTIKSGRLNRFLRAVIYRTHDRSGAMPLSLSELTTMAHLPPVGIESAPGLRQAKSVQVSAPPDLPQEGALLGLNRYGGGTQEVRLPAADRLRHFYVIGQTGTGKSTLLKNVIMHDIQSGSGVCFIDPHGSDVLEILSAIPPERRDDVIYFDPGEVSRPIGLNMLEYDVRYPEQKSLVVDELLGIFKKLFGAVPESMGPAFEQYFRNAALLVMEDPDSGSTLLDISRIFSDSAFRELKLSRARNPVVVQFWRGIAMQATGEQGLENYGPYVTNKFDVFTSNEIMRPIIAQQHSAFDFRSIMDQKKILLVNLAKGRIGDLNANLLGLIIVGKFLIAALSRADSFGKELPPFYLHIDEFQNFTTPSIATIFSEARKYGLSLTVAHQFIAQLTDEIRDAVFGNVGSLCAFRVGPEDAKTLAPFFAPQASEADLIGIDNRNAIVRLLLRNKPEKPFTLETVAFKPGTLDTVDQLRQMSYVKYGRDRAEVEAEVMARY